MFLRFLINRSPIILTVTGIVAVTTLGYVSYRYLYPSISHTEVLTFEPPAPIEFIDAHRIEQLQAFFRELESLPPIDPATVRDVFSTPGAKMSAEA